MIFCYLSCFFFSHVYIVVILLLHIICVGFHRFVTISTSILGDSKSKVYLIKQIHQFKSGLSIYCRIKITTCCLCWLSSAYCNRY